MRDYDTERWEKQTTSVKGYDQWICWKYSKDRTKKVPLNPSTGAVGNALSSECWGSYADALVGEIVHRADGIGFVLTEDDPYTAIDIDDCINSETGHIEEGVQAIVNSIDSYWEVSPSLTGLRGILLGTKPGPRCTTLKDGTKLEVYDSNRWVSITGITLDDYTDIRDGQSVLNSFYQWLFPDDTANNTTVQVGEGFSGSDKDILSKARNVGQWKLFRKLYGKGNWQKDFKSQSEADYKLCKMLAFWCGPDEEHVDRLFRKSKLYRKKWDEQRGGRTYGEKTIAEAIAAVPYFYSGQVDVTDEVEPGLDERYQWMMSQSWSGRSGPTERHVYLALLDHASKHGKEHERGITVSMSRRDLMIEAGLGSRRTVDRAVECLHKECGVVEVLREGKGRRATEYLLVHPAQRCTIKTTVSYVYGAVSRTLPIRNASKYVSTIGKRNAQILDIIHTSKQPVPLEQLAETLKMRERDLQRRNLDLLSDLGLIEYKDGGYITPTDFQQRLEREIQESGCAEAYELQKEKIEREREAFRTRKDRPAEKVSTKAKEEPVIAKEEETYREWLNRVTYNPHVSDGICHCSDCNPPIEEGPPHPERCQCYWCSDELARLFPIDAEIEMHGAPPVA